MLKIYLYILSRCSHGQPAHFRSRWPDVVGKFVQLHGRLRVIGRENEMSRYYCVPKCLIRQLRLFSIYAVRCSRGCAVETKMTESTVSLLCGSTVSSATTVLVFQKIVYELNNEFGISSTSVVNLFDTCSKAVHHVSQIHF